MSDRLPHNLEAEGAVLGAMLMDREIVAAVLARIRTEDFYAPAHAPIFAAISRLFDAAKPTDKIAVCEELARVDRLNYCGGPSYLSSLMQTVQTVQSAEHYATIIAEKAVLRRVFNAAVKIQKQALGGEVDVTATLAEIEAEFFKAVSGSFSADLGMSLLDAARSVWNEVDSAVSGTRQPGISSPWPDLDLATGRTFGGEFVVWAAAPQMGKSIAVGQNAIHIAIHDGAVALFALEMGIRKTVRRMLGKEANITSRNLRLGKVYGSDWERLGAAMDKLGRLPVRIFDRTPRKSVSDVRRALLRMSAVEPVKAVFIDHANFLAEAKSSGRMSKTEALDEVYKALLEIASEFDCVMHVVQHLNREGMKGEPNLENLRDGGNLEGHADIVIFPYRPNIAGDPTTGEFIIAKNRDQELRRIGMYFDGARQEWREAESGEYVA